MAKSSFKQGDIVLIPYPYTDLSSVKKRPVIILSRDTINRDSYIVAKITSVLRSDGFSFQIQNTDLDNPIPKQSEVRTNEIFTAHKSLIIKKFCTMKRIALIALTERVKDHITVPI